MSARERERERERGGGGSACACVCRRACMYVLRRERQQQQQQQQRLDKHKFTVILFLLRCTNSVIFLLLYWTHQQYPWLLGDILWQRSSTGRERAEQKIDQLRSSRCTPGWLKLTSNSWAHGGYGSRKLGTISPSWHCSHETVQKAFCPTGYWPNTRTINDSSLDVSVSWESGKFLARRESYMLSIHGCGGCAAALRNISLYRSLAKHPNVLIKFCVCDTHQKRW